MSVIKSILLFIENHLDDKICVDAVVKISGYSRRTVHSIFIEEVGISPGAYIRRRKLCKAAVWLRLTSMSGTEIAFELGFSSHQSFSREFTRYFGVSPRAYRNSESWDMSLLVPPVRLMMTTPLEQVNSQLVSLQDILLSGSEIQFTGELPCQGGTRGAKWRKKISDSLNHYKHDLFFVSEVEVIPGGVNRFLVNTFIGGVVDSINACGRVKTILGGLYLKYRFSGTSVDYSTLSSDIAIDLLPVLGLKRRRGADIEYFKYSGEEMSDAGVICCDYYMPVSR